MKDFDFDLPSTAPLTGYVMVPRAAADITAFKGKRYCPMGAWLHLYMVANTEPGETMLRGIPVRFEAGWVLRSVKRLADTWGWDRETASKFLTALEKAGWIEFRDATQYGRVIVLVDYKPATYLVSDTETRTELHTETDTETRTEGDGVMEGVEKPEGGEPPPPPPVARITPTQEDVVAYATTAKIDTGFAEDWFLKTASSARFGFATLLNWQFDLLRYWRLKNPPGGAEPKKGARPAWASAADLRALIERHPANSTTAFYNPNCTAEQQAALKKMRARLRELQQEEASTDE